MRERTLGKQGKCQYTCDFCSAKMLVGAGDFWTPCPEVPLSAAPSLPLLGLILPPSGQVEKVVDVGLDRRRRPLRQGVIVGQPVLLEELERGGHLFQIVDFRPPLNLNSIINSY